MTRRHIFISGRVQGVCFRRETKLRASLLRVRGFVENLKDGRVECILEGEERDVDKLIGWMRRGPAFAKVTDLEILEEHYVGDFSKFDIKYQN